MNSKKLEEIAAEKAAQASAATEAALEKMIAAGAVIDFATVSREAGVSRKYLYENKKYRAIIISFRTSDMTKCDLRKELFRLRSRNRELEEAIEVIRNLQLPQKTDKGG